MLLFLGNICFEIKRLLKKRMGTIFILVLVQIMNMNTTMHIGCTESSQKAHKYLYWRGVKDLHVKSILF
jgi:hypothetical protein